MKNDISYLTDHYGEKIDRIRKIGAPLNFIFYTDPHNGFSRHECLKNKDNPDYPVRSWESMENAVKSMQYVIDRLPEIKCLVCGGDLGNDYADTPEEAHASIREAMELLYGLTVPVHCLIGNHDDCVAICRHFKGRAHPSKFALYPRDLHEICMRNNPTEENYYYTDFDELGYRFIFLNTSDFYYGFDENGNTIHPIIVGVSRNQVLWFKEAVKTDKKVIVFSHAPISIRGHFPDCTKQHEDMANGDWLWYEMQSAENVIAAVAGHLHYDNLVYDGKLVAIDTSCATAHLEGGWDPAAPKRKVGTVSETCFDVFSVTDEVIYCTRFGAGEDRVARIIRNFTMK